MNEYTINVDIKRDMSSVIPTFAQGDSATIYFRVFDDGENYDYSDYVRSETRHRLPNSKQVIVGAGELVTRNGEKLIKYEYDGKEMVETGFVETNLTIYTYSTNFSVRTFPVHIYDNLHSETLGYIEYLQKLLEELEFLKQGVINQLGGINSIGTVSSVNNYLPDYNGNVTIPNANTTTNGLMTSQQLVKLSGISAGANYVKVDDKLDSASTVNALSANKGKELNDKISEITQRITFIKTTNQTIPNNIISAITFQAQDKSNVSASFAEITNDGRIRILVTGEYDINFGVSFDVQGSGSRTVTPHHVAFAQTLPATGFASAQSASYRGKIESNTILDLSVVQSSGENLIAIGVNTRAVISRVG